MVIITFESSMFDRPCIAEWRCNYLLKLDKFKSKGRKFVI